MIVEMNFDGFVGPSHNYSGLSPGNIASTGNKGLVAFPRAAALQGLEKMRHNLQLGLAQGLLPPHRRPNREWLQSLGTDPMAAPDSLRPAAFSASAMWAANAATVSPAADTVDGRCHLTVANLRTMPHRSHEWRETLAVLRLAFADDRSFVVHPPVPAAFGDEGAANHMRLGSLDQAGIEVFVYGISGGAFPARQHVEASRAIVRRHGLDLQRTIFAAQSRAAIDAGAFHNDVVAVSNGNVLFAHEQAFEDKEALYAQLRALLPDVHIIEVPAAAVSLAEAVATYLFNAQLVTLPGGVMALILPEEACQSVPVWTWLRQMVDGNGPIRELSVVDVRQSMANGGGPACLRLRVAADPATVDARFLVDERRLDRIAACVEQCWPEQISPDDLKRPELIEAIEQARSELLRLLDLGELE
ncbi:MAG: N-succinylarginine dihydrolase [Sphingosinicella sp.]